MKGSKVIFALAAIVIVLGATALWAQGEFTKPLDKVIKPGRTTVKFDTYVYTFVVETSLTARFEKLDATHVKLTVKPVEAPQVSEIFIQWGAFPPQGLTLDSGGDSYILNTETGYAEK